MIGNCNEIGKFIKPASLISLASPSLRRNINKRRTANNGRERERKKKRIGERVNERVKDEDNINAIKKKKTAVALMNGRGSRVHNTLA